jgi:hypothetical protein
MSLYFILWIKESAMIVVPYTVFTRYDSVLNQQEIPISQYADYKKWLRFYLDFCAKYPDPKGAIQREQPFLEKLREKKQSEDKRKQAAHAIALYCDMQEQSRNEAESIDRTPVSAETVSQWPSPAVSMGQEPQYIRERPGSSHYTDAGYQVKSDSPEWDAVLETMAGEIKVRHYSRKTLKTYANWSRQIPHLPSLLRHPPVAGQLRYPHHSDAAWALQPQNYDDLHPLRAGENGERTKKPAGSGGVIEPEEALLTQRRGGAT